MAPMLTLPVITAITTLKQTVMVPMTMMISLQLRCVAFVEEGTVTFATI
jgi:hypothetical protein